MADQSNVQTTIGSPIEWYKLEVLRDTVNVKEAWESYNKQNAQGYIVDLGVIRARTQSLYNSLVAYLGRKFDTKKFQHMRDKLFFQVSMPTDKELLEIYWDIQIQLDKDNITKMDTRRSYDGTRVEMENKNFGN
jgi:hypothetical protein